MLELRIAKRYTFTKYKERFVSIINAFAMLGISLGVATLIIVMSVMNGYEKALFTKILGFKGHITVTTRESKLNNWEQVLETIRKNLKNTDAIVPMIEQQALAMTDKGANGVLVKGMFAADIDTKIHISDGFIHRYNDCHGIIIGEGIEAEDKIKIIIPRFTETMVGMMPRMKSYNVCGTFDIGMHEYNKGVVFMDILDAQVLFEMNHSISGIEITLKDIDSVSLVKNQLIEILRKNTFENPDMIVVDWQQANKTLLDGLKVERTVMFLILSLIVIIAAFNIISSLILLVHDKMKEIAILRTIGMRKISVMRIFIMCGSLVGVIGTIAGTIFGIVFSINIERIREFLEGISNTKLFDPVIYFLTTLPSDVNVTQVIWIVCISLTLSFLATIYPAWRVSKTSPAEVLRY